MQGGPEAVAGAAEVMADRGGVEAGIDAGEENDEILGGEIRDELVAGGEELGLAGFQVVSVRFMERRPPRVDQPRLSCHQWPGLAAIDAQDVDQSRAVASREDGEVGDPGGRRSSSGSTWSKGYVLRRPRG